jgi:hypothetical protein
MVSGGEPFHIDQDHCGQTGATSQGCLFRATFTVVLRPSLTIGGTAAAMMA